MAQRWDDRWKDFLGHLHAFAARRDREFVAAFLGGENAEVEIRRSAPDDNELAREYTTLVHTAGFRGPTFLQVPVSTRNQRAIDRLIAGADDMLGDAGIRVGSIGSDGHAGDTRVVSYEDPQGHGIAPSSLHAIHRFPPGTVELRRVTGRTVRGA